MWRIRHLISDQLSFTLKKSVVVLNLIAIGSSLFLLRVIERVDPRWTLPIWLHAALVVLVTLTAISALAGQKGCLRAIPVIAFGCTAIPLPTLLESFIVSNFTDSVVYASSVLLQSAGMQVQTLGDRLAVMNQVVQVTEGCSGVRSAQSFLMSSLFLGELMRLQVLKRVTLIAIGLMVAWALNVIRASTLAAIQVRKGREAFDQAHDHAGLIAYIAGLLILLTLAILISNVERGKVMRREVGSAKL